MSEIDEQHAREKLAKLIGKDLFGKSLTKPWCCPEPRCMPVWQIRDRSSEPLQKPQPGQSFGCWGRLGREVAFIYDGVEHKNELRSCFYTALKGVISWHETPEDWVLMEDGYHMASARLRALSGGAPDGND